MAWMHFLPDQWLRRIISKCVQGYYIVTILLCQKQRKKGKNKIDWIKPIVSRLIRKHKYLVWRIVVKVTQMGSLNSIDTALQGLVTKYGMNLFQMLSSRSEVHYVCVSSDNRQHFSRIIFMACNDHIYRSCRVVAKETTNLDHEKSVTHTILYRQRTITDDSEQKFPQ